LKARQDLDDEVNLDPIVARLCPGDSRLWLRVVFKDGDVWEKVRITEQ